MCPIWCLLFLSLSSLLSTLKRESFQGISKELSRPPQYQRADVLFSLAVSLTSRKRNDFVLTGRAELNHLYFQGS